MPFRTLRIRLIFLYYPEELKTAWEHYNEGMYVVVSLTYRLILERQQRGSSTTNTKENGSNKWIT